MSNGKTSGLDSTKTGQVGDGEIRLCGITGPESNLSPQLDEALHENVVHWPSSGSPNTFQEPHFAP
jgi:hypothetical protein